MLTHWLGLISLSVTIALPCLGPQHAHAAWPHDPNNGNVALSTAPNGQRNPTIVSDGAGGAIVAWQDSLNGSPDIYVQRVNAVGLPLWSANGVALCTATGSQNVPTIASDGMGGAIVAWQDSVSGNADIYAGRVSAAGVALWTANGVALSAAANSQFSPTIVSDGSGGAVVAWSDTRSGNQDIYAQRVSAGGVPLWAPDGAALCTSGGGQSSPTITTDVAGGAIIAWVDARSGSNADIYAQRVSAAGAPLWTADGVALCTAAGNQLSPAIAPDGAGGAIVSWSDARNGNDDIYAQRVSPAGAPLWTFNGNALCTAAGSQSTPTITTDGVGGAIIAWDDFRSGTNRDVYARRISAAGALQWTTNGVALCTSGDEQFSCRAVSDGVGGAIVTWSDFRSGTSYDVYAQRVNAIGAPQWTANGVGLSTAANAQFTPVIASDGAAGAIVVWVDFRGGSADIYAQRIERFGRLGNPEPVIAGVRDVPNDQGGRVKISWYPSYLDEELDPKLVYYDVYRSAPGSLAETAGGDGAIRLSSFAGAPMSIKRAWVIDPASTQLYAWEYLATVNAVHFLSAYGYIASTTGDSIAGSNPPTVFMVVGRDSTGSLYWMSAPDSGYSVDNLPPAIPGPFTGQYSAGTASLHWGPNVELDFARYDLHRGTGPGFTPGLGNLVTSQPDTGYTDLAGQPFYYKLAAIDVHGNSSGFALLLPQGTVDVPGKSTSVGVALGPAQPNPVSHGTEFRIALPREERVTLALFDQQGRRVRDLASGFLPAGEHSVRWDGRDGAGRPVPSGMYICRLEAGGMTLTRRLVAVH